jgi:hypothetical protein
MFPINYLFIFIYIFNILVFFIPWIITHISLKSTNFEILSYLLVVNNTIKITYIVWYSTYILLNLYLIYVEYKLNVYCASIYMNTTFLKLIGFLFIYMYDLKTYDDIHFMWTFITIVCCIKCSIILLIKRIIYKYYNSNIIYVINMMTIILQIIFATLILGTNYKGIFELLFSIMVSIDPIYQFIDLKTIQ